MRFRFLTFLTFISFGLSAQKPFMPFFGGIELGIGYSSFIDFNLENNGVLIKALPYQIQFLPYEIGIVSAKYINSTNYLELGIFFSKRSDSYVKKNRNEWSVPFINLYCFDFPLKFYLDITKDSRSPFYIFGGLIPTWIYKPDVGIDISDMTVDYFTSWYLSACSGVCFERGRLRWKLHLAMSTTSIIKTIFSTGWEIRTDYGRKVYPFEALLSCAFMIK